MAVTATSNLAKLVERARMIVAASSTFQTLANADDEDEALNRIHRQSVSDRFDDATASDSGSQINGWPRAVVRLMKDATQKLGSAYWGRRGSVMVLLQLEIPRDAGVTFGNIEEEELWALNQFDAIAQEIRETAGIGESVEGETHLNVINVEMDGPYEEPRAERPQNEFGPHIEDLPRWWCELELEVQA